MKYLIFFVFLLFSCKQKQPAELISKEKKPILQAKNVENQKKIDIIQLLLNEEIKENKSGKVDYKSHSVSFENDGDSYQVHFSELAAS